ncbi:hypothetical protein GCM10010357_57150 [Streptomyces luteireticuli]|uniref:Uncharacterized protein n=1 Tax=Streptomyces luteireticuli TaxID=173858 RepID=A0ABN0Z154_9ACTN
MNRNRIGSDKVGPGRKRESEKAGNPAPAGGRKREIGSGKVGNTEGKRPEESREVILGEYEGSVRSLRTQQRAKSQRQTIKQPRPGWFTGWDEVPLENTARTL